ncbi:hypothetical protein D3C81_616250 [compost metagenome]
MYEICIRARDFEISQLSSRNNFLIKFSVSRIPIYLSFSLIVIWLVLLICTLNVSWGMMIPDFIVGFQPKR